MLTHTKSYKFLCFRLDNNNSAPSFISHFTFLIKIQIIDELVVKVD